MYSLPENDLQSAAERVLDFWPQGKSFLITGGTGFFGRWLLETIHWIESKKSFQNRFYILTRQTPENILKKIPVLSNHKLFQIIQKDLGHPLQFDFPIDYVLHAATDVAVFKSGSDVDFSSAVTGTANVLQAVSTKHLQKFLYVSSGGVYDKEYQEDVKEQQLPLSNQFLDLKELSTYALAKRKSESLLYAALATKLCVARCFAFVGPYADPKMAVMQMIESKVSQQKIQVNSPEVIRSFLYPSDLVVILLSLLLCETRHDTYNVGSSEKINLKDLAEMIDQLSEPNGVFVKVQKSVSSLASSVYFPNTQRLQSEFKYVFSVDLKTALKKTFQFESERKKV